MDWIWFCFGLALDFILFKFGVKFGLIVHVVDESWFGFGEFLDLFWIQIGSNLVKPLTGRFLPLPGFLMQCILNILTKFYDIIM